jgi:predicted double-glycine peptidase
MSTLGQRLRVNAKPVSVAVPHYAQSLDFTCGPSSLLMVMKALDPAAEFDRTRELILWKEATTMYMGGPQHGGSSALGLAIAADRRGFEAEVLVNHRGVLLADRGRTKDRREVMRLLHEADLAEAEARGIPIDYREMGVAELEERFRAGWLPIVLVTTLYVHGDDVAHWVVVTGFDAEAVYINDPWVDRKRGKTPADMTNLRIPVDEFVNMAAVGKKNERSVVLVRRRDGASLARDAAPAPTAELKRSQ